jgi:hypothetical protein
MHMPLADIVFPAGRVVVNRVEIALQLLENAAATAAGLFTFILMFRPGLGRS